MISFMDRFETWKNSPALSEEDRAALRALSDPAQIKELFRKDLGFGTGGIRGIMGLGSACINPYVVRKATAGFALMLLEEFPQTAKARGIAIAWDSRNNSKKYALETAVTLAAYGIKAFLFPELSATPLLSFAVRHLGCCGGVVITASHNAKEYNGYKAYDETGCQLSLEGSKALMSKAESLTLEQIPVMTEEDARKAGLLLDMPASVYEEYIRAVESFASPDLSQKAKADLKIVYTPLHGAGNKPVRRVLQELGYSQVSVVKEQELPDGDFPTVKYPNPEVRSAVALAMEQAKRESADLIIATDPDSDRMGITAKDPSGDLVFFGGNQIGVLMLNYLISTRKESLSDDSALITTVVTGRMGPAIAQAKGLKNITTLIGFKHICGALNRIEKDGTGRFFFGYEESFGYLAGNHTRDKDGVLAALLCAEMAAYYKEKGLTLPQVMEDLYKTYGYYKDVSTFYLCEGPEGRAKILALAETLRKMGTGLMEGLVKAEDYLPGLHGLAPENLMKFYFENGSWIAARPSGTEPKMKVYYSIKGDSPADCEEKYLAYKAVLDRLVEAL